MADIFISYQKTDREVVLTLVQLLESEGWTVWWDTRLASGEQWDKMIEAEINLAKAVLVVWSSQSVNSQWVREEANFARDKGNLVPVTVGGVTVPFGYSRIQAADLSGWNGKRDAEPARRLVEGLRAKIGAPDAMARPIVRPIPLVTPSNSAAGSNAGRAPGRTVPLRWLVVAVGALALIAGGAWVMPKVFPPAPPRPHDAASDAVVAASPAATATAAITPPTQVAAAAPAPTDAGGMYQLGLQYANGQGQPQDYAQAREWYERAAAAGSALAMNNLGALYASGNGVARDNAKARGWYEKAAAAGNPTAMGNLGDVYDNGTGVAVDFVKAREWYDKAASNGVATAMTSIGYIYSHGQGVTQDYAKAREWYEKAAAAGDGQGMSNIGYLYDSGKGVPQDFVKAREWYEKAVSAGIGQGMSNLAFLLDSGQGGAVDYARAAKLFLQAAKLQDDTALKNLHSDLRYLDAETRIELKRKLNRLGFYNGPIDANWDEVAKSAVDTYMKAPG